MSPSYFSAATAPDGNIYTLPSVHGVACTSNCALFVNKVWLDQLGLELPTTTDEFEQMLIAFKNAGDLNGNGAADELPFTFRGLTSVNGIGDMFGAFGRIENYNHIVVEDGKVIFTPLEQEWVDAVTWFAGLYAQDLLDKEGFTQDDAVTHAKIKNDPLIIGAAPFWTLSWAKGNDNTDFVAIEPLKGPTGEQHWACEDTSVWSLGSYAISKDCEIPEIAFRWGDLQFREDLAIQSSWGTFDDVLQKDENGEYVMALPPEGMTDEEYYQQFAPRVNGIFAVTKEQYDTKFEGIKNDRSLYEKNHLNETLYAPYTEQNYFPKMLLTTEEVEQISLVQTEINNYVVEKMAGWMLNGGIEKEYDEFVEELENMGVRDYIAIYQGAYDRYTAG